MNTVYRGTSKRTHLIVIAVSLVLIVLLTTAALVLIFGQSSGEMSDAQAIEAKLTELEGQDLGHERVWRYFIDYGIGGFNTSGLEMIESTFAVRYIGTLPDKWVHAHAAARMFLEHFYENIDLASETDITDALIRCYVEASGDDYAKYRNAEEMELYYEDMSGAFVGIGVQVQNIFDEETEELVGMVVTAVIDGGGAKDAGIRPGDYIVAVDGINILELGYDGSIRAIRGEEGTTVNITVLRGTETLTFTCVRKLISNPSISCSINENMIGYIKITEFVLDTDELFIEALNKLIANGAKGIVFDLRDNPGGALETVVNMLSALAPKGTPIVSYQDRQMKEPTIRYADAENAIDIPLAFICNENTASAGELFCSTLRDWGERGIIDVTSVGVRTYGKGVMQRTFANIMNGSSITLTISYYNPPYGKNYDRTMTEEGEHGIVPLIEEADTERQLEKAYEEIAKLIKAEGGIAA